MKAFSGPSIIFVSSNKSKTNNLIFYYRYSLSHESDSVHLSRFLPFHGGLVVHTPLVAVSQ